MNEFMNLRKIACEKDNPYIFFQLFFEKYVKDNNISINQQIIVDHLRKFRDWNFVDKLKEEDTIEMMSALGENEYLDSYISEIIINCYKNSKETYITKIITSAAKNREYNDLKLYHILDICLECNIDCLDKDELIYLIEKYKYNYDMLTILIDYISTFELADLKIYIYDLMGNDYPDNIKVQLLDLVQKLYSLEELEKYLYDKNMNINFDKELYEKYIKFFDNSSIDNEKGLVMMQSMFYGDFEDSGKGNNGGLAVFLKSLGSEMSKDKAVASIVTININQDFSRPFAKYYTDKHLFIRLPIYIDMNKRDPFIKRELFIKRYIYRFLKRANIIPDIFHIRYLDNSSNAISNLRKELNKKLVFTLTPDPHRNMFDRQGKLVKFSFDEFMDKLNKIRIGDKLLYESDGILGIGNKEVKKELHLYFPQLEKDYITKKITMIGEGIQSKPSIGIIKEEETMRCLVKSIGIDEDFFNKPIILNVGRLNSIKGQDSLLKAWGDSTLCKTHNLLIIGGDLKNPNREEQEMMKFFNKYLDDNTHLKKNFVHIRALPNDNIMIIEKSIMRRKFDYPNIYLCSSKKEEFGIAILEAMVQKLLVLAPINGGVKSYIKNRVNGFLIDTSNSESIARETEKIIHDMKIDKDEFEKIQLKGHETVEESFSVKKIAQEFLSFYLSL